jgi:DMSO/TMAO reductase YedYZ molybdopterin-dependent catalytic subunit
MGFFERNRKALEAKGIDPARVPPGQYVTDRFPVLHAGVVPDVDLATWDFTIDGLVGEERRWNWAEFGDLASASRTFDIHWAEIRPDPSATHVLVRAYHGFTANLPLADFLRDENLFAHTYGGEPLEPEHGYPLRLVVPHLYFWKSVKWVQGFTLLDADEPGFWERNGYHMYGDPFKEQRFWGS